jgi:poly(glycerol-phosphate) alpha-glucosyltransferase
VTSFPAGRYFSAGGTLRVGRGGQTGAMLLRSRTLGAALGRSVDVLTFDPSPHYDRVRTELLATGHLDPGMSVLNLFEHYRDAGWGDEQPSGEVVEPPPGCTATPFWHPDGTPWKTEYHDAESQGVFVDYQRRDGSVYLRASPYRTLSPADYPATVLRVGEDGQALGRFSSLAGLYQRWLGELAASEPAYVVVDSRFLVPLVAPHAHPDVHVVYLLHNCHVLPPRRWDSPSTPDYTELLRRISDVEAFVTLTERQGEDIRRAWGDRDSYAVVPHPVEETPPPAPLPARDRHRVVMLARLHGQKRVEHALAILSRVRRSVPEARLDVYGEGARRPRLEALIERRGLQDAVTLHGHDPTARDQLWSASACLVTSEYEGYGLVIAESLSRGCPVVSYDVPYGPREQVEDGVNGFLVPDADLDAAAARLVDLLSSPALVESMSRDARAGLGRFRPAAFVENWASVFTAVAQRSGGRLPALTGQAKLQVAVEGPDATGYDPGGFALAGRLALDPGRPDADAREAHLTLAAVHPGTGAYLELPVRSRPEGHSLVLSARLDPAILLAAHPELAGAALQLRVSWRNAFWSTTVTSRTPVAGSGLGQQDDGTLRLVLPPPVPPPPTPPWQQLRRRSRRRLRRLRKAVRRRRRRLQRLRRRLSSR